MVLTGTEVKSLRTGKASIGESYASLDRAGELYLVNATIPEYLQANRFNHEPKRQRKLLLNAREIVRVAKGLEREGMTLVPLKIYLTRAVAPNSSWRWRGASNCTISARARSSATGTARRAWLLKEKG